VAREWKRADMAVVRKGDAPALIISAIRGGVSLAGSRSGSTTLQLLVGMAVQLSATLTGAELVRSLKLVIGDPHCVTSGTSSG
jgi:hypothetical protein